MCRSLPQREERAQQHPAMEIMSVKVWKNLDYIPFIAYAVVPCCFQYLRFGPKVVNPKQSIARDVGSNILQALNSVHSVEFIVFI